ncbi:tyrosine-protein phosphatase [Pseudonocardia dioxanivorans]|uniref:tyrosine-protein phosphatase n=1 Tax=Pseudonocardia dioxanivorans TaxID=240495 RepID=UPI000CD02B1B|nr:tyrosine-protein phosphatase [Pseudonocardia dioxanivorans]
MTGSLSDAAGGLVGAFNFRDLGGLRAGEDLHVRRGVLFRSDTLQALTPADVSHLTDRLRLELIVDLRIGPEAVSEGRGPMAEVPVSYLNAPLRDLPVSDLPAHEQSLRFYVEHLESPGSVLSTVVRIVAAMAGRPVLLHCAAGKDRTGLVVALLLRLLGVDDEDIVADYLRSGLNMPRIKERFLGWPRYRDHMATVPAEVYDALEYTIRGFLAELDARFGGARDWARERGISDQEIARLRAGLLAGA